MLALEHRLHLAVKYHLLPLKINVDGANIIQLIISEKSKYLNIVSDCRNLLCQLGNPPSPHPISHTYREANGVTDALAKEGANMYNLHDQITLQVLPTFVQSKIDTDRNETLFERIKHKWATVVSNVTNITTINIIHLLHFVLEEQMLCHYPVLMHIKLLV